MAAEAEESAPGAQWQLRSTFMPITRATINVAIFRVGRLERLQIAAYTRADLRAEWRFNGRLSVTALGQHLFSPSHVEFGGAETVVLATQVPRSVSLRLRWMFL
jgi:hypothetical protein